MTSHGGPYHIQDIIGFVYTTGLKNTASDDQPAETLHQVGGAQKYVKASLLRMVSTKRVFQTSILAKFFDSHILYTIGKPYSRATRL